MRVVENILVQAGLAIIASGAVVPNGSTESTPPATLDNLTVSDLWNLYVGPVQTANVTTVVAAIPVRSSELIPPPFIPTPSLLCGQIPVAKKNESCQFPKGFWWGVAGAAYQTEGAAKDEGRGPSIWDVMSHRASNYVMNNDTADIADNHYYLYKEGMSEVVHHHCFF